MHGQLYIYFSVMFRWPEGALKRAFFGDRDDYRKIDYLRYLVMLKRRHGWIEDVGW